MYPGLSDADCQVAAFHYRQLVVAGQRQQIVPDARPVAGITRLVSGSVRRQVGALPGGLDIAHLAGRWCSGQWLIVDRVAFRE